MKQLRINHAKFWEVVATIAAGHAAGWDVLPSTDCDAVSRELCVMMSMERAPHADDEYSVVAETENAYDRVYRDIEDSKADEPYPVVLGRALGLGPLYGDLRLKLPADPGVPLYRNALILAPFALRRDLEIPLVVWRHIARFCRSYGRPVLLLGDESARMDIATFTEGDLLGRQPLRTILATLAAAELVVGVPNEWMWLAASYNTKVALLYPETVPPKRWFWYGSNRVARGIFTPSNVQTPVVLTTIRKIFEVI